MKRNGRCAGYVFGVWGGIAGWTGLISTPGFLVAFAIERAGA